VLHLSMPSQCKLHHVPCVLPSTWFAASVQRTRTDHVWRTCTCQTASLNYSLTYSSCVVDVFVLTVSYSVAWSLSHILMTDVHHGIIEWWLPQTVTSVHRLLATNSDQFTLYFVSTCMFSQINTGKLIIMLAYTQDLMCMMQYPLENSFHIRFLLKMVYLCLLLQTKCNIDHCIYILPISYI